LSNRTTAFPLSLNLECVTLAKHGVACSAFSAAMSSSSDRTTSAHRELWKSSGADATQSGLSRTGVMMNSALQASQTHAVMSVRRATRLIRGDWQIGQYIWRDSRRSEAAAASVAVARRSVTV